MARASTVRLTFSSGMPRKNLDTLERLMEEAKLLRERAEVLNKQLEVLLNERATLVERRKRPRE